MQIDTKYEGLALPLIIDGKIIHSNLKYASLDTNWLNNEIKKAGASNIEGIFLAELNNQGQLYVSFYKDTQGKAGDIPPII